MTNVLSEALEHLRDVLQSEAHEHCYAVDILVDSKGYHIGYRMRTPGSLKRDGLSMQNLRGEWIV